jgi:hypothetical protein
MEAMLEEPSRDLSARLETALAELADGCPRSSDIAAKLGAAGCQGLRRGCRTCPVAVWLTRKLALPDHLLIFAGVDLAWIETAGDPESELGSAVIPPVVAMFIGMFDRAGFDSLDAAS